MIIKEKNMAVKTWLMCAVSTILCTMGPCQFLVGSEIYPWVYVRVRVGRKGLRGKCWGRRWIFSISYTFQQVSWSSWYKSRLGCERSRVQLPDWPCNFWSNESQLNSVISLLSCSHPQQIDSSLHKVNNAWEHYFGTTVDSGGWILVKLNLIF